MTRGAPLLLRIINDIGAEGWEMVMVTRDETGESYLFKRRRRA